MEIQLTFKKEDSGYRDFLSITSCPIAKALKRAGYTQVNVGGMVWTAISPIGIQVIGPVPYELDALAIKVSNNKIEKDINFTLNTN